MKQGRVVSDITFCVSTVGNTKGLLMCLSSVLNATRLPGRIQIRCEGEFPSFSDFYLEQLSDIARYHGIDISFNVAKGAGIRKSRQWHLETARTNYIWMGDDDVVFDYDALEQLLKARDALLPKRGLEVLAYVVGNKKDINNRRGYGDFSQKPSVLSDYCSTNLYYDRKKSKGIYPKTVALDTGFCLINRYKLRYSGIKFDYFPTSFNAGGEDNFFGLQCDKHGLQGFFAPCAQAFHLEKEKLNFSEFAARAEAILRSAEAAGIANGEREFKIFPWLKVHNGESI